METTWYIFILKRNPLFTSSLFQFQHKTLNRDDFRLSCDFIYGLRMEKTSLSTSTSVPILWKQHFQFFFSLPGFKILFVVCSNFNMLSALSTTTSDYEPENVDDDVTLERDRERKGKTLLTKGFNNLFFYFKHPVTSHFASQWNNSKRLVTSTGGEKEFFMYKSEIKWTISYQLNEPILKNQTQLFGSFFSDLAHHTCHCANEVVQSKSTSHL